MANKIQDNVDYKRPEWKEITDSVVTAGNAKHLRGVTPAGLPKGGYWEYRKRAKKGRVYLIYNTSLVRNSDKKSYVIASVDSEFAQLALKWQPTPHAKQRFNFPSGSIIVHYDALALPCHIEGAR